MLATSITIGLTELVNFRICLLAAVYRWCASSDERRVADVAEISTQAQTADDFCEDCGYEPELKRTLGSFQVFAISFAFISVAVGIFGTYDDVLQNAGPVGIWLWVIVAVGQTLVALVIAQFAARIPLSGSSYQWALAAGQPEDRLGVRLADLLLPGDRRGGRRQRAGEPGIHAAVRHGAGRGHRARDHGGGADHSGRARDRSRPASSA